MAADATRILVALDYGTTYTGLAFASTARLNESNWQNDIIVVTLWAGEDQVKVPSRLSYSDSVNNEKQYGFNIAPGSSIILHTKLEFLKKTRAQEMSSLSSTLENLIMANRFGAPGSRQVDRYYAKSPQEVCKDYLDKIVDVLLERIAGAFLNPLAAQTLPVDLILSHPAIWNEHEKKQTFQAVTAAFRPAKFPHLGAISFISEPEACALYTLKTAQLQAQDRLRPGEVVIVCDAGGGTVDFACYQVESTVPTFKTNRVGKVTGDKCGAIFIDQYFLNVWLRRVLREDEYDQILGPGSYRRNGQAHELLGSRRIVDANETQLLASWEEIKCTFGNPNTDLFILSLPAGNQILDDPSRGILNGTIQMQFNDLREIFEEPVNGVLNLLDAQVKYLVDTEKYLVSAIYLSGGFGTSNYLFSKIESYASGKQIRLLRGEDCRTAVVRGSLMKVAGIGAEQPTPTHRSPGHVGICVSEPFLEYKHFDEDRYVDGFDGQPKAADQIRWLIARDEPLPAGGGPLKATFSFKRRFEHKEQAHFRLIMAVCYNDRPAVRRSELNTTAQGDSEITTMDYDLVDLPLAQFERSRGPNKTYYEAVITLTVRVTVTEFPAGRAEFTVSVGNTDLAHQSVPM